MKINLKEIFFICLIAVACIPGLQSQEVEKRNYQTAFTDTEPDIDGYINDPCWNMVEWSGDFIQMQPYENIPPSQQTAFKVLYDDNNLYVFIRAYDTEPDNISRRLSRRDYFDGDMVEINIDSYYDKQTAFSFTAMASGAKGDEAVTRDGNNWDSSWNPVWYLKTSIDDEGWCAEMKIPFNQLRFGKKNEHIWGIQLMRHIFRLNERSNWQYIPKGSPGTVHLFGELHGINNIKPKRQVELIPYTVGKAERFEKEEGNPFSDGKSSALSFGLDGKVAVTNDFMLDFTINPDFGQVEADPSEVNLTAFETYFSERRPFFIEGKNIYEFTPSRMNVINNMQSDNLFYSRRIGRYPQSSPSTESGQYVDMPDATTILGAMKLSGKTKNGLSVGILESVTANEKAVLDIAGTREEVSVEPLTNYFVGRLQKDFNKGETMLGGMFTAVNRDIENPDLNFLHTAAYTGGIDFQHNWKERTWYVAGNAEFSYVKGDEEAIINTQRSSARYFQRPDADYVSVDSSLTSLSGVGGTLKFGHSSKKKIRFESSVTLRSPGLELNDIGYMRYADVIHHGTWVGYQMRDPFFIFNNFYLNTNYWMYWNFSGTLLQTSANVNFNSEFKNRWNINGSFTRFSESVATDFLRGGPSFTKPGGWEYNTNLSSDGSKDFQIYFGNYYSAGDDKSFRSQSYWMGIEYHPLNTLSMSFDPDYGISSTDLQYVSTCCMEDETQYIFAELNQKTLSFTFRANLTLTPDLSLEYYGQPFVSAGKYSNYKMITDPDADNYTDRYHVFTDTEITYNEATATYTVVEDINGTDDYSFDNPDFNFRQFRSNLVIRWEYKPGSTLYFVCSQGRTSNASDGTFSYGHDMRELFNTTPQNVFLLKLSYRQLF